MSKIAILPYFSPIPCFVLAITTSGQATVKSLSPLTLFGKGFSCGNYEYCGHMTNP